MLNNLDIYELKNILDDSFVILTNKIDTNAIKEDIAKYEEIIESTTLWDNPALATQSIKTYNALKAKLQNFMSIKEDVEYMQELYLLLSKEEDALVVENFKKNLIALVNKLNVEKTLQLFDKNDDIENCYLEIHAGTGGLDAQDFAQMLCRMYTKFCSNHKFKYTIIDENSYDGIGIKSATLKIEGDYAFGWLKNETGVHRLIRLSPFNSDSKRHTSFASVEVVPDIVFNEVIEITDKDLKIDTYRSSGAGGQHVNTTDSAVRITHIPTGIVVKCQAERSQHKNKDVALKMLKLKLYNFNQSKINKNKESSYYAKQEIDFGSQIRTYTLHPYQLVKDNRDNKEISDVKSILDGNLDDIILSILSKK